MMIGIFINLFQNPFGFNYSVFASTKGVNFKWLSREEKTIFVLIKITKLSIIILASCSALYFAPQSPLYESIILVIGLNLHMFTTLTVTCVNYKFIRKLFKEGDNHAGGTCPTLKKLNPHKFYAEYTARFEKHKLVISKFKEEQNGAVMKFDQGKATLLK